MGTRDEVRPAAEEGTTRRSLLKGAALTGVGAAVAATPLAMGAAEAAESPQDQVKARYQETPHVKRYYDLNRL